MAAGGHRARRVHGVGESHHARDHRLDALESGHRQVELRADARVGAGRPHPCQRSSGGIGGQRDAAAHRQLLHQHAPAAAGQRRAADDAVERHEHVLAEDRSVLKRDVEREVAPADAHPGRVARDQRAGDADVDLAAEQVLGVEHAERQADDRGHRRKRDVALGEVELQPEDLASLPQPARDDAGVGNGAGVRTGTGTGEGKARYFLAARQARQVIALLFLGAVVVEKLCGPEGIGHGDGGGGGGAAARDLGQHARVRVSGEFQAAVAARNDHREEAAALEEVPHLRRQVGALVRDVPVIEHAAQLLARPVEEGQFLGRQLRWCGAHELLPARRAAEQLPVPPHGAGLQRLLFGLRHRGQQPQVGLHERPRDQCLAQEAQVEQPQQHQQQGEEPLPYACGRGRGAEQRVGGQEHREGHREGEQRHAAVGEEQHRGDEQQRDDAANLRHRVGGRRHQDKREDCTQHESVLSACAPRL